MKTIALVCLLLIVVAGCSHLRVDIAVLNPAVVTAEDDRRLIHDSLPAVLAETEESLTAVLNIIQDAHRQYYLSLADAYRSQSAELDTKNPKLSVSLRAIADSVDVAAFTETIAPRYGELGETILMLDKDIQALQASAKDNPESTAALQSKTALKLRERRYRLRGFFMAVEDDAAKQSADLKAKLLEVKGQRVPQEGVEAKAKILSGVVDGGARSVIPGDTLWASPYHFAVAAAPETEWKSANDTWSKGQFGAMNVAIKLDPKGEYTIKGVTFDPSDVVRVAAKVTTQSLLFAAQIGGVPVKTTGATGTGSAVVAASGRLADAQAQIARAESDQRDYVDALLSIADQIVQEASSLDNDTQRKGALDRIRQVYDAQKSRIKPGE